MKTYTEEQLKTMTWREAEAELSNLVYSATFLIERLEYAGKVRGNGHHVRQEIVEFATEKLKERWIDA